MMGILVSRASYYFGMGVGRCILWIGICACIYLGFLVKRHRAAARSTRGVAEKSSIVGEQGISLSDLFVSSLFVPIPFLLFILAGRFPADFGQLPLSRMAFHAFIHFCETSLAFVISHAILSTWYIALRNAVLKSSASPDPHALALWEVQNRRKRDPSLWAQCLVETDGDEARARARYIRERAARLAGRPENE